MTLLIRLIAIAVGLGFTAVSIAINLRYGVTLGGRGVDGYIFMGLSIVADAWKSIGLIFIVGAFRQLRLVHGAAGSAAWIVCVIYSLSSALGYAAESRSTMVGWQTTKSGALAGYQGELQRKQRQLDAISHHEPASVTLQKLAVERQKREWNESRQCDGTTARTRAFCIAYRQLETAMATSQKGEELEGEVKKLRATIAALGDVAAIDSSGDGLAKLLSDLFGLPLSIVQLRLSLLIVAVVELGSMFILLVALQPADTARPGRKQPKLVRLTNDFTMDDDAIAFEPNGQRANVQGPAPGAGTRKLEPAENGAERTPEAPGRIEQFALEMLIDQKGQQSLLGEIEAAYRTWCRQRDFIAIDPDAFDERFRRLSKAVGYSIVSRRRRIFVVDVVLAPHEGSAFQYLRKHACGCCCSSWPISTLTT